MVFLEKNEYIMIKMEFNTIFSYIIHIIFSSLDIFKSYILHVYNVFLFIFNIDFYTLTNIFLIFKIIYHR